MATRAGSVPTWAGQGEYDVRFQWGPLVAASLTEPGCAGSRRRGRG